MGNGVIPIDMYTTMLRGWTTTFIEHMLPACYCLFGVKHFFNYCYVRLKMRDLKGMDERLLPSKDEPLTLNIDKVMAMYVYLK